MKAKILAVTAIGLLALGVSACTGAPGTSPTPTVALSQYQLEYRLLAKYSDFFWCDPDYWPIVREGQEEINSVEQFPEIKANAAEFSAILEHLNLANKADYSAGEKLSIYREHKKLMRIIQMTPQGSAFKYELAVGENEGYRIVGTITTAGKITETGREGTVNTCPICLAKGTLIDKPEGAVPVEQLQPGTLVWTANEEGERVAVPIVETRSAPVPPSFKIERVTLDDGRNVEASPWHPAADGRALSDYRIGDILDGASITAVDYILYNEQSTYDILPSGTTGLYWANGILLKSTLKAD